MLNGFSSVNLAPQKRHDIDQILDTRVGTKECLVSCDLNNIAKGA